MSAQDNAWNADFLDRMQCEGDPPADEAIGEMLEATDDSPEKTARILLRQLLGGGHHAALLGCPGSQRLAEFLAENSELPDWADPKVIEQAQYLCRNNLVVGSVLLAVASLPECYLDARGTPVLASTGQLSENPTRRLRHTAHMVFSVCAPGGLVRQPGEDESTVPIGVSKALTVRLLHALIRRFTIDGYRLPESFYQDVEDELGIGDPVSFDEEDREPVPVNQEDQAFVLLTFSYVVVRGLDRLGVKLTPQDRDAYVHLWNVVGHIMGVRRELMAKDYKEAEVLFNILKKRLAGPSPDGEALIGAIMTWVNRLVPRPLRVLNPAAQLIRYFIGSESAEILGIHERGLDGVRKRIFDAPLRAYAALKPSYVDLDPLAVLVQYLAGPMVRHFMAEVERPRPAPPVGATQAKGAARPSPHAWPDYIVASYGG